MGAARPAEGGLDRFQGGAVRPAGDLLEVKASGYHRRLFLLPGGIHADSVAVDSVEGERYIFVDTIPLWPVPVRPANHGALDGVCGDGQISVGLAAEGGRYAALLHAEGIAALVVQYLDHAVAPGGHPAVCPQRGRHMAGQLSVVSVYPRACCSNAALSIGGRSLPRRSARRKIP